MREQRAAEFGKSAKFADRNTDNRSQRTFGKTSNLRKSFAMADQPNPASPPTSTPSGAAGAQGRPAPPTSLGDLPPYAQSLLRVSVPVVVTLASTKLPLQRILELGPGSLVPFDKPCEEPLTLQIGSRDLAVGEAVKVGDKFGLRINSMVLPQEKFWSVRGKRES